MKRLLLPLVIVVTGCGSDGDEPANGGGEVGELPAAPCNPLGSGDCLAPFPSTAFLVEDATAATGWRVSLAEDVLPVNTDGTKLDPTFWNGLDGFSPATYLIAYFPGEVDGADLAPPDDPGKSLDPSSPTVIVEIPSGDPVPHFAELDANAEEEEDRQGLILRPVVRLKPGTRYAVGLRRSLGPDVPAGFAAILDGQETEHAGLEALRPAYDTILSALDAVGYAKEDLLLAWDFRTGSDETHIEPMQDMIEQGLDAVPTMTYTVQDVQDFASGDTLRTITGVFGPPNFLASDGRVFDPIEPEGTYTADFTVLIPRAALSAPVPVLLFGHGIFGTGRDYVLGPLSRDFIASIANQLGYVVVATDWVGLSNTDRPDVIAGLTDANLMHVSPERLRQALVNTAALGRLARDRFAADPDFMDGPTPLIASGGDTRYWGISLGGLMGQTLVAYHPDIERAAFGVAGGNWGMLIQRSSNWPEFRGTVRQWYPDTLDELKLLLLWQSLFDFSDSITTAPRLMSSPPSGGDKRFVIIEALCDSQVANVATETVARTMGLPITGPTLDPVPFGLEVQEGALPAALTRFDLGSIGCPGGTNAPVNFDNGVHACVNLRPAALREVADLLSTGMVANPCGGACDCGSCSPTTCTCSGACE